MGWFEIIVLGIVQGVTEFLPVSSSGHLVIVAEFLTELQQLPLETDNVRVNILLHAGTLGAILLFYRRRILALIRGDWKVIGLLVVGTVPAVCIGLPLHLYAKSLLSNPLLTGLLFIATGILLIFSGRSRDGGIALHQLRWWQALVIGMLQALAILPGLSRSGWTICGGLLLGMRRDEATTFSFLLAIPAICGAIVLELGDLFTGVPSQTPAAVLAVGTLVAFFVGLVSLWGLIAIVQRGRLAWFACWLIPLGLAVIAWQAARLLG